MTTKSTKWIHLDIQCYCTQQYTHHSHQQEDFRYLLQAAETESTVSLMFLQLLEKMNSLFLNHLIQIFMGCHQSNLTFSKLYTNLINSKDKVRVKSDFFQVFLKNIKILKKSFNRFNRTDSSLISMVWFLQMQTSFFDVLMDS